MKREILFRGKSIAHHGMKEEWVYGFYSNFKGVNGRTHYISDDNRRSVAVQTETVGQYTGLKDKKGTKIFEGDIIKRKLFTWRVFWFDRCAGFYISNDMTTSPSSITPITNDIIIRCEVIGNIYDNPSLLKEN